VRARILKSVVIESVLVRSLSVSVCVSVFSRSQFYARRKGMGTLFLDAPWPPWSVLRDRFWSQQCKPDHIRWRSSEEEFSFLLNASGHPCKLFGLR